MRRFIVYWSYTGTDTAPAFSNSIPLSNAGAKALEKRLRNDTHTLRVVIREEGRGNRVTAEELGLTKLAHDGNIPL